jgi:hypothetical protein
MGRLTATGSSRRPPGRLPAPAAATGAAAQRSRSPGPWRHGPSSTRRPTAGRGRRPEGLGGSLLRRRAGCRPIGTRPETDRSPAAARLEGQTLRSKGERPVWATGDSPRSGDQVNSGGARGCALAQACRVRGVTRTARGTPCVSHEGISAEALAGGRPRAGAWSEQAGQCSSTCAGAGARSEPSSSAASHWEPWVVHTSIQWVPFPAASAWPSDGASVASRMARAAIQPSSWRWERTSRMAVDCRCEACGRSTLKQDGDGQERGGALCPSPRSAVQLTP